MKQVTNLDLNALKKRVAKVTKTKDALSDVTPFVIAPATNQPKIIIDKDSKKCVRNETSS